MLSCCFTGHRAMSMAEQKQIFPVLNQEILNAIKKGVTVFRSGGALGFDTIAALSVLNLKKKYPEIKLYVDVPHRRQCAKWSDFDKSVYRNILASADKVTYVSAYYEKGCMQKRNRYMVDNSDMVIAYVKKASGGSYYTACYAKSLDKEVINLGAL